MYSFDIRNTWDTKDIRDINIRGTRDTMDTRDIRGKNISGIPKTLEISGVRDSKSIRYIYILVYYVHRWYRVM